MRRIADALSALLLGLALTGCWEQPGFDAGHSYWNSGETTITAANVAELTPLWSTPTGDGRVGSLLSSRGRILALRSTGYAVGLNAATGAQLWETDPVPDWDVNLSSSVIHGGELLVGYSLGRFGGYARLNPATGELLEPGGGPDANNELSVADGVLAEFSGSATQHGVVGQIEWQYSAVAVTPLGGPQIGQTFAVVGDRLAWALGTAAIGHGPECTGMTPCWRTELGGVPLRIARLGDGRAVYVDDTGTVTALDVVTGEIVWSTDTGGTWSPVVAGGLVVVGSADGRLVALFAADGTEVWSASVDGASLRPAAAGGDVVYTVAGGDIVAFDLDGCGLTSCSPLTTLATGGTVGDVIVDSGRVVATLSDGRIVAFGLPGELP